MHFQRFPVGCPLGTASVNLRHSGAYACGANPPDDEVQLEDVLPPTKRTRDPGQQTARATKKARTSPQ